MASDSVSNIDISRLCKSIFSEDWMVKTGVGGIMAAGGLVAILYSFMCLPIFAAFWALIIGYNLRCIRQKTVNPEQKLPEWNDWGDLFMSGITFIALQTGTWFFLALVAGLVIIFTSGFAFNEKNTSLSLLWSAGGSGLVSLLFLAFSLISSYTMVNFAVEENVKAGVDYFKVIKLIASHPLQMISGFLLSSGIQIAAIALPCITVIGVFLLPSIFFVGQILSASVLAAHWPGQSKSEA